MEENEDLNKEDGNGSSVVDPNQNRTVESYLPPEQPTNEISPGDVVPTPLNPQPQSSFSSDIVIDPAPPPILPPERGSRFSFISKKIILLILLLVILLAGGLSFRFFLNEKVTSYTLLPDDTEFYLGLSVKKHPQVEKLKSLTKKLPGGEKLIDLLDKNRAEIFGRQKDPFAEILNLAENEVFLAKISKDVSSSNSDSGFRNTGIDVFEKLVNIVEFENKKIAQEKINVVKENSNVITTQEAYGEAKLYKFKLKEQKKDEMSDVFDTGPLPYQVTLPFSKDIFATNIDKFIVAAEKESDVKKLVDLATKKKEKKLKSITEDKEHNEIASHFPQEYLLKFYQRQVVDPLSNVTPSTALPQNFLFGQSYDTTEKGAKGDNVFTTKRGLTIVAKENGMDFTSYQLTKKSQLVEGLKHGFTIQNSLANNLPASFDSKQVFLYTEANNIKDTIRDQMDYLSDVANNSSDPDQKKSFEAAVKDIETSKKEIGKALGIDVDEDILSWMDKNASFIFAPGFGGKAPEALFVFEVSDSTLVEQKLAKISIEDYVSVAKLQNNDALRERNIELIAAALQDYYTTPGNGSYPNTLQDLIKNGSLKNIPYGPDNEQYKYIRCDNGKESAVYTKLESTRGYWIWTSFAGVAGVTSINAEPKNCNVAISNNDIYKNPIEKRINSTSADYKGTKIYTLPIYEYEGEKIGFRFTVTRNMAVVSIGVTENSLKEIIDFQKTGSNILAADGDFVEQFENAPANIGGIVYIVPENMMGIVDYIFAKAPDYKQYVEDDYLVVARGYLKSLKSIGSTTTQAGSVLISNTFVNIEELQSEEKAKVAEAVDRLLKKFDSRNEDAADSVVKSDVGEIAVAMQSYYTSPGNGFYPLALQDLVSTGDLGNIPISPDGESYKYLRCAGGKEAAVYQKLNDGKFWVWSSESGRALSVDQEPKGTCIYGRLIANP